MPNCPALVHSAGLAAVDAGVHRHIYTPFSNLLRRIGAIEQPVPEHRDAECERFRIAECLSDVIVFPGEVLKENAVKHGLGSESCREVGSISRPPRDSMCNVGCDLVICLLPGGPHAIAAVNELLHGPIERTCGDEELDVARIGLEDCREGICVLSAWNEHILRDSRDNSKKNLFAQCVAVGEMCVEGSR